MRLAAAALVLAMLAGCSGPGRPATDPRFIGAVRAYYNANAAEPQAGCTQPLMVVMRSLRTVSSFGVSSTLRMRAGYEFEQRDPVSGALICSGTGDRFFTLFRGSQGPRVIGMDGPRREQG